MNRGNSREKKVFAHYMVCCPAAGTAATRDDLKQEILEAQKRGLDGFMLNCGGWEGDYKRRCQLFYDAARQLNSGFVFYISMDFCCGNGLKETRDAIATFRDHPNQFRYQGKPVLTTFGGEKEPKGLAELAKEEGVFFIPYFYPKTYHENPDPADVEQVFRDWPTLDGYYFFAGVGNGEQISRSNHLLARKWLSAGKMFMAGVTPYYRSYGRLYETRGFESMAQEWEGAIQDDVPWIEITTWNDWEEKTYVAPFGPPENVDLWKAAGSGFGPVNYSHVAYLDASRYYIDWFKSGKRPRITEDMLFYFYRTESKAAQGRQFAANEIKKGMTEITGAKALEDRVFVTAFLTAPAELSIYSGPQVQSFTLKEGVNHVSLPFAQGKQRFTLRRKSAIVLEKTGEQEIRDNEGVTRYNYFAGSAGIRK